MVFANEPYLLRDGKTLYFAAADSSGADWDLFRASGDAARLRHRSATASLVGGNVNGGSEEVAPVVTEDEEELFFATDRAGGSFDVWTATKDRGRSRPGLRRPKGRQPS